jgi:Fur family ferric uptake transcriptional regulator
MTPQRELVFRSFFELGKHVSVGELYDKVRQKDHSVGYSTVWRNLKLICRVGLAEEVNIGDGVTRYDRVTQVPHGHLYCQGCKQFIEFNVEQIVDILVQTAQDHKFAPEGFKIEVQGYCEKCRDKKNRSIKAEKPY